MQDVKEIKKKKLVKKSSEDTPTGKNGATRKTSKRKSKTPNSDNNLATDNKVNKFNVIQNWCCCLCQVEFQIEEEKPIVCDRCEYPVCITCSLVPPSEFSVLTRADRPGIWCCRGCKKSALTAIKNDRTIEEKCKEFLEDFRNEFDQKLKNMKDDFESKIQRVESELSSLKNNIPDVGCAETLVTKTNESLLKAKSDLATTAVQQSTKEMSDRDRRKCSLIWFGVPESKAENPPDKVKDDISYVQKICDNVLKTTVEITKCVRHRAKPGEVRPLLINVKEPEQVANVLKNGKNLRDYAENDKLFVKKDETPLERIERKRLTKLRNQKREETKEKGGDEQWEIRRGRVVNVKKMKGDQAPPAETQK